MGKKRSRARGSGSGIDSKAPNETFDDSEDEFLKGRDQILFDDEPAAKRRRKLEEQEADLQPSDEEVYADDFSNEDDEEAAELDDLSEDEPAAVPNDDEEDEQYWGETRSDYYNADTIETEQDALDEEAEARRLQQKQMRDMTDADFGFDDLAWGDAGKDEVKRPMVEKLPPVQIPENATTSERLEILSTRYPEFKPLAEDLTSHYTVYLALKDQVYELRKAKSKKARIMETRLRALAAYLAAIAMYMAVLTSTKDGLSLPPTELREHPVMNSLLQSRQLWEGSKELDSDAEDDEQVEDSVVEQSTLAQPVKAPNGTGNGIRSTKKAAVAKEPISTDQPSEPTSTRKDRKKVKKESQKLSSETTTKSKKSKSKSDKPKRATLEDLMAQDVPDNEESDFGDEVPLTTEEAAEKARKKKSLRFYTSQIAQKAGKRAAASRQAGGDDDLPYKERIRDRQDRLMREAEQQRNQKNAHENADFSDDYDENDLATKMNTDANDYYTTLVGANATKKADKAARAEAHRQAAAQGAHVYEEATVGPDGKRKITYAIEKNKGLMPRRKKEVRNPRVKKKLKFEEKQKKLASMRPTWKGGEGKGGYKGELTGIKSNLVKSVKL